MTVRLNPHKHVVLSAAALAIPMQEPKAKRVRHLSHALGPNMVLNTVLHHHSTPSSMSTKLKANRRDWPKQVALS